MDPHTPSSGLLRCFVALPLPAPTVAWLRQQQQALQRGVGQRGVKWVRPEQMHLTLRFLGNTPEGQIPELSAALGALAARCAPFELNTGRFGCFPDLRRPRVLWLGLEGNLEALSRLQRDNVGATRAWGDHQETQPFHPHLTLGRTQPLRPLELARIGEAVAATPPPPAQVWQVAALELVSSSLTPTGPIYRVLSAPPLTARRPN